MPRLTESKARTAPLPTDGNQRFVWCSEVKGFGVRVTIDGVRSYIVQTRVNGQAVRKTLGASTCCRGKAPPMSPARSTLPCSPSTPHAPRHRYGHHARQIRRADIHARQAWDAYVAAGYPMQNSAPTAGTLKAAGSIKIEVQLVALPSQQARQQAGGLAGHRCGGARWCDAIVKHSGGGCAQSGAAHAARRGQVCQVARPLRNARHHRQGGPRQARAKLSHAR